MTLPPLRLQRVNSSPANRDGKYVLYWMTAARRVRYNFALDHAIQWAESLDRPLVIFEPLRCGYPWASDRIHRFVIQGMADNLANLEKTAVTYFPYVERAAGEGKGLLDALAKQACVVVTDDFPCFFLPRMLKAASQRLAVLCEAVDSNGLFPMRGTNQVYPTAYAFRRMLQKNLRPHLSEFPQASPLEESHLRQLDKLPKEVTRHWHFASEQFLAAETSSLRDLPIDHSVGPGIVDGGATSAEQRMRTFVADKLRNYAEARNEPEQDAASGLSPYLHFGHISVHAVFSNIMKTENWSVENISSSTAGKREGWWGMSPAAEAFLDELVTWRELGYNMCWQRGDYDQYESLPSWAQATLEDHAKDPREPLYKLTQLESSQTHDQLWNAAQNQLVREGRMHNYLRMLWGKKILEWTAHPKEALSVLIHLNNKYALDGRNPNSYSGIFWCLGRYDRPWGPERPIFGKIRYMSSENTAKKFHVESFIAKYTDPDQKTKAGRLF